MLISFIFCYILLFQENILYKIFTSITKDNILLFLYYLKNILRLRFFVFQGEKILIKFFSNKILYFVEKSFKRFINYTELYTLNFFKFIQNLEQ